MLEHATPYRSETSSEDVAPELEAAAAVLPFDEVELCGLSAADAREIFGSDSTLQVGALDYFVEKAIAADPDWPGVKEERRKRLEEWALVPDWQRASSRHRKSWSEKGIDFLLCGIRCRVVKHEDSESGCERKFSVPEYCRLRGCPRCGDKQADDFYNKWIPRLLGVAKYHPKGAREKKPWGYRFWHITLTSKKPVSRPSSDAARVLWKHFLSNVGLFCRAFYPGTAGQSSLFPTLDGCGALIQGEVGRNDDGTANWNQHAHVIVFGPRRDVDELKRFWSALTGASGFGVQVRHLGNDPRAISKTLRHMFKYYRKPFSYDPETFVETIVGMDGVRLRRGTGIFYRDRRGSSWADSVALWESCCREELEALGQIPARVLKCFDCGGILIPDYRKGTLWRSVAFDLGFHDWRKTRDHRGPPRFG